MAYEVTASRRRPQRFENLVGQEFIASTLKNSIERGHIAHAYLFSGPRGTGKTSSARILAKALNCEHGPASEPCGACPACKEITAGSSIDVIEIDGASNTGVNDVRQIKDEVIFPPNSSRYKIYIIDEVHQLTGAAFNALLKTIEEPPPYIVFIFATTELHKVPATIKSRCQQFYFRLVAVDQIKTLLREAAAEMDIQAEDEALYWIAREATGSIRDAYTLFDQVASFADGHITWEKIRDKLGLVGVEKLNELFDECADGNTAEAILKFNAILEGGVSIEQFISNAADYFRALLFIQSGIKKEALLGQSSERFSQKALASWNAQALERAFSLFLNLYRDVRYSLDPRFETELAVSRVSTLASWVSPAELRSAIEDARTALAGTGANAAAEKSAGMPASPQGGMRPFVDRGGLDAHAQPPQKEDAAPAQIIANPSLSVRELKQEVISALSKNNTMISSALAQTADWMFENDTVSTNVDSAFLFQQLSKEHSLIASCINDVWGKPARFALRRIETAPAASAEITYPEPVEWLRKNFKGTVTEEQA